MRTDDPMCDLAHAGVSQLFAGVQADLGHQPGPNGCSCLKADCRSRLHAVRLLTALGVDLAQLTPPHAKRRPRLGQRAATTSDTADAAPSMAGSPHRAHHALFPARPRTGGHR